MSKELKDLNLSFKPGFSFVSRKCEFAWQNRQRTEFEFECDSMQSFFKDDF